MFEKIVPLVTSNAEVYMEPVACPSTLFRFNGAYVTTESESTSLIFLHSRRFAGYTSFGET